MPRTPRLFRHVSAASNRRGGMSGRSSRTSDALLHRCHPPSTAPLNRRVGSCEQPGKSGMGRGRHVRFGSSRLHPPASRGRSGQRSISCRRTASLAMTRLAGAPLHSSMHGRPRDAQTRPGTSVVGSRRSRQRRGFWCEARARRPQCTSGQREGITMVCGVGNRRRDPGERESQARRGHVGIENSRSLRSCEAEKFLPSEC